MNEQKKLPAVNGRQRISGFSLEEIGKFIGVRLPRRVVFSERRGKVTNISAGQKKTNVRAEDLMSKLPDEILSHIISFLTIREAAGTSIISKRWRYLWRDSLALHFDFMNMTGHDPSTEGLRKMAFSGFLKEGMPKFVGWVNQILQFHCGASIKTFKVEYMFGKEYQNDIDQWYRLVANREVENLSINWCIPVFPFLDFTAPIFPHWYFVQAGRRSTLKHLSLDCCTLNLPQNFVGFCSLKSLTLKGMTLAEENVGNILSSCLSLEWLSIEWCYSPVHLKFSGGRSSLKLQHLSIRRCLHLAEIEICGTINLVSFEYAGEALRQLLIRNTTQLVRLRLSLDWNPAVVPLTLGGLPRDIPHLETLLLTSMHLKGDEIPKQLATFTKLKELVVERVGWPKIRLELISSVLSACPFLHKLELHLSGLHSRKCTMPKAMSLENYYRHLHLREVVLYGFHGDEYEFEVALYLLNNAVSLKKMKIACCSSRCYLGDGKRFQRGLRTRRKKLRCLFRQAIFPPVQLVIV